MTTHPSLDTPVKPRVLIADDSRIVRATLIKHIEGMFEFREALDGEEAWETLLLDPSIRVVITDLTMPKLDGYGLLERIRNSRIARIRELPVVVVSGSDEREERERAKAAGATDLITKGIGTAQLLSRLEILSNLVTTQREFERSLEVLMHNVQSGALPPLPSATAFLANAEQLLGNAARARKNFVLLNVCIGLKHVALEGVCSVPPASVVDAIGHLLQRTVRQSDYVAKTGEAEFMIATGSINSDSAHHFAQRICRAVANAHLVKDERMSFIASCGVASLSEDNPDAGPASLQEMQDRARRRALLGMHHGITGAIGQAEEGALQHGSVLAAGLAAAGGTADGCESAPDLATLLQWIKEGRQDEVLPHLGRLSSELQPLVDLVLSRSNR